MRYARGYFDADTHDVVAVMEQDIPFRKAGIEMPGRTLVVIDLGGIPDHILAGDLHDIIERHPLADSHEDAPQWRFKPDAEAPQVIFTPCGESDIVAHLSTHGLDRLPADALQTARAIFASRDNATLAQLRAVGLSFAEIKALPRYAAARSAVHQRAIDEQQAAQRAAHEAAEAAKLQARIDRKLNKGKP